MNDSPYPPGPLGRVAVGDGPVTGVLLGIGVFDGGGGTGVFVDAGRGVHVAVGTGVLVLVGRKTTVLVGGGGGSGVSVAVGRRVDVGCASMLVVGESTGVIVASTGVAVTSGTKGTPVPFADDVASSAASIWSSVGVSHGL